MKTLETKQMINIQGGGPKCDAYNEALTSPLWLLGLIGPLYILHLQLACQAEKDVNGIP